MPQAFPDMFALLFKHFERPEDLSPVTVLRFSINTGPDALMGNKYKTEVVRVLTLHDSLKLNINP